MYVHFIVHIHVSVFFIRLRFEDGRLQETPDSVSAVCRYSIQCNHTRILSMHIIFSWITDNIKSTCI